jgi:hypothetical protein
VTRTLSKEPEVSLVAMNPVVAEMMAHTRMADLQRAAAAPSALSRRGTAVGAVRTGRPTAQLGAARSEAVRRAIGWFLVSVGLRLALPRPRPASAR